MFNTKFFTKSHHLLAFFEKKYLFCFRKKFCCCPRSSSWTCSHINPALDWKGELTKHFRCYRIGCRNPRCKIGQALIFLTKMGTAPLSIRRREFKKCLFQKTWRHFRKKLFNFF